MTWTPVINVEVTQTGELAETPPDIISNPIWRMSGDLIIKEQRPVQQARMLAHFAFLAMPNAQIQTHLKTSKG